MVGIKKTSTNNHNLKDSDWILYCDSRFINEKYIKKFIDGLQIISFETVETCEYCNKVKSKLFFIVNEKRCCKNCLKKEHGLK